jgi:hypothetical protein
VTNQEHSPTFWRTPDLGTQRGDHRICRHLYTDESAEGDGMALAGKQAIRFKSKLRLLIAY